MKSLIYSVVAASLVAAPAVSFAQSNAPVTRAQVRAELIQLEQAGWRPSVGSNPHYPEDMQAAQARVAAQSRAAQGKDIGPTPNGASQSARPASADF